MGWEDSEDWLQLIWIAAAALLVGAGIVAIGETPAPNAENWPAWVQAGGSIAAILAVIWVQQRDHRRSDLLRAADAADRRAMEAEFLNLVIAYARVATGRAQAACQSQDWTEDTARYALSQMQSHMQLFDAISIPHLPNRDVVSVYYRGLQAVLAALRQVEMVLERLPTQPSPEFFDVIAAIMNGLTEDLAPWVAEKR